VDVMISVEGRKNNIELSLENYSDSNSSTWWLRWVD